MAVACRARQSRRAGRRQSFQSRLGATPWRARKSRSGRRPGGHKLGFSFQPAALVWIVGCETEATFALGDGLGSVEVSSWVDARLEESNLNPASSVVSPYQLEDTFDFSGDIPSAELVALCSWYAAAAAALGSLVADVSDQLVSQPQVRCWKHHFDIAALCMLEEGDPETARSIGVGMSPGDGAYSEPYFYASPWPAPPVDSLPPATAPLRWNTDGFVSLVVLTSDLREVDNLAALLDRAFRTAHEAL